MNLHSRSMWHFLIKDDSGYRRVKQLQRLRNSQVSLPNGPSQHHMPLRHCPKQNRASVFCRNCLTWVECQGKHQIDRHREMFSETTAPSHSVLESRSRFRWYPDQRRRQEVPLAGTLQTLNLASWKVEAGERLFRSAPWLLSLTNLRLGCGLEKSVHSV